MAANDAATNMLKKFKSSLPNRVIRSSTSARFRTFGERLDCFSCIHFVYFKVSSPRFAITWVMLPACLITLTREGFFKEKTYLRFHFFKTVQKTHILNTYLFH